MRAVARVRPVSAAAVWCRRVALFALAVGAVGVLITRLRVVEVPAGLAVVSSAIVLDCVALLLAGAAAATIWRTGRRGVPILLSGLALAAVVLALPAWLAIRAIQLPVMNDVSTDLRDPPQFMRSRVALTARGGATPAVVPATSPAAQRLAYPDVQPILVELEPDEAYQIALKAAVLRGWTIVDQSPPGAGRSGAGHIDAIDRTPMMGFPDDVTIRVRPLAGQTRIDVRSASRYGRNDFGANARRIERFAQELQGQLDTK